MAITPRERVWQAIRHQQPDRVPYHLGYTVPARRKLEAYYGTTDLDDLIDDHLAVYSIRRQGRWEEIRPGYWRDEFGVVWNRTVDKDIGVVEEYQIKGPTLAGYTLPDPLDPRRYAALPAYIARNPNRFRIVNIGFALFERAWSLRSMPELLVDMLDEPAWVEQFLAALTDFNLATVAHLAQYDIDGILFGDDWGQQQGLIMGPRCWRRYIKPCLAQMYAAVKRSGRAVFIHCCGRVQELFPELIALGLDVFNPFQPEVMDPYAMKRMYGRDLAFYGGMSIQRVMPFGTPQEVRDEARRLMDGVGAGGGYIISPAHEMPGDIPVENMVAFVEAVRGQ